MNALENRTGTLRIKYLLGALVALVILDGLVTKLLIRNNLGHEANPFLEPLIGGHLFIPLKIFGAVLCSFILWDVYRHWPRLATLATSCFVVIYSGIVIWNFAIFLL